MQKRRAQETSVSYCEAELLQYLRPPQHAFHIFVRTGPKPCALHFPAHHMLLTLEKLFWLDAGNTSLTYILLFGHLSNLLATSVTPLQGWHTALC